MDLTYEENRPAPNGYYYRGCQGTVRSSQPLTLGDVIDGTLNSLDMFMGKESTVGTGGRYDKAISDQRTTSCWPDRPTRWASVMATGSCSRITGTVLDFRSMSSHSALYS
jgi:hypothetical protein